MCTTISCMAKVLGDDHKTHLIRFQLHLNISLPSDYLLLDQLNRISSDRTMKKSSPLSKKYGVHDKDIGGKRPLSDYYDYLMEDDKHQFEFKITHLVHRTNLDAAKEICPDGAEFATFKPNKKDWSPKVVWFSSKVPEEANSAPSGQISLASIREIWNNCEDKIENEKEAERLISLKEYRKFFPSFNIVTGYSLYGTESFVVSWKNIRLRYAESRNRKVEEVELRCLGTFLWEREIMFAILVCCKGDKPTHAVGSEEYPLLGDETVAYGAGKTDDHFIWKCFSLADGWNSNSRKDDDMSADTWDHLSFAFYFPEDTQLLIPSDECPRHGQTAIVLPTKQPASETPEQPASEISELEKKMAQL